MPARIGDLAHSQLLTASLLATQGRMREAQLAVATGKAATRYDQIADAAGLLLRTEDSRQLKTAHVTQNERLTDPLQAMDTALGSLVDIAERARASLVQRQGGTGGADMPLATEVEAMLAEVAAALNTELDGDRLFAGSRSDTAPVELPPTPITTADPTLYYRGDDVRLSARAEQGIELGYGVTAGEPAFATLIAALGQARAAHLANDGPALKAAGTNLTTALDSLVELRSGLAAKASRLEAITETQRAGILYLDDIAGRIEDADPTELLSGLARDQANIEASYLVTGRLASLSLADYLG
jgi:flagellar hook-associated protein 3 FlgL